MYYVEVIVGSMLMYYVGFEDGILKLTENEPGATECTRENAICIARRIGGAVIAPRYTTRRSPRQVLRG